MAPNTKKPFKPGLRVLLMENRGQQIRGGVTAGCYKAGEPGWLTQLLQPAEGMRGAGGARTMKWLVLAVLCLQLSEGVVRWVWGSRESSASRARLGL